jgi:two-component system NtrC family response regulator
MNPPTSKLGWTDVIHGAPTEAEILVVEDEPDVCRGLVRLLERFGYQVKAAASAEEADHWMSSQRFDVLLLDIELPRMKGVEFLAWALDRDPQLAVIMMTGLDSPEIAIECVERGARTYMVKPPDAEFLRLAVRDALAMRRLLVERNELA